MSDTEKTVSYGPEYINSEEQERKKFINKNYDYTKTKMGMTITRYKGDDEFVVIPDTINGMPVTAVGTLSFFRNKKIKSIVFPDTIKLIDNSAFRDCDNLISVTFSENIEKIGSFAFLNCKKIDRLKINGADCIIDALAFANCSSVSIAELSGVKEIRDRAFQYNDSLRVVVLSDSIEYIGNAAFSTPNLLIRCNDNSCAAEWADRYGISHKTVSNLSKLIAKTQESER